MHKKDVIIACDFNSGAQLITFLGAFGETRPFLKIGMELLYAEGPGIVREVKRRGHRVFLDLKLHDIPNTVKKAMGSLSSLGVDMIDLHAAGGSAMMRAACEGLGNARAQTLLIAVTQLTSTNDRTLRDELLIERSMEETVVAYAKNAAQSGLNGVVCSPLEAAAIKRACGDGFLTVTPGIRFADADVQDQNRVTTPADAKTRGSDFIVVGRPITEAADPLSAYARVCADFLGD